MELLRSVMSIDDVLRDGSLRSVFHPVVDLQTLDVVGHEALVRGPAGPLERPDLLFAAARAAGRLAELDAACRLSAVRAAVRHELFAPLTLFVNVEPEVLEAAPLDDLGAALADSARPLRVVLDVPERTLAARPAHLLATVERVRALGWGIALDGVAASSATLALLSLLRPDVIKLQLRQVRGRPHTEVAQIMDGVSAYGQRTGSLLLAEGIEDPDDLLLARSLGARLGQGWMWGRPEALPGGGDAVLTADTSATGLGQGGAAGAVKGGQDVARSVVWPALASAATVPRPRAAAVTGFTQGLGARAEPRGDAAPAPSPGPVAAPPVSPVPIQARGTRATSSGEELLRGALAASSHGIAVWDATQADHPIIFVNEVFERLCGLERAELLGRRFGSLSGPETDPDAVARMEAAVAAGEECTETLLGHRGPERTPWWYTLHLAPVTDAGGAVVQYIGLMEDVTERVLTQQGVDRDHERVRDLLARIEVLTEELRRPGAPAARG